MGCQWANMGQWAANGPSAAEAARVARSGPEETNSTGRAPPRWPAGRPLHVHRDRRRPRWVHVPLRHGRQRRGKWTTRRTRRKPRKARGIDRARTHSTAEGHAISTMRRALSNNATANH
eukprot:9580687-Alexandrium_andersonii.AAC.1